jgi:hypothetical protein
LEVIAVGDERVEVNRHRHLDADLARSSLMKFAIAMRSTLSLLVFSVNEIGLPRVSSSTLSPFPS